MKREAVCSCAALLSAAGPAPFALGTTDTVEFVGWGLAAFLLAALGILAAAAAGWRRR